MVASAASLEISLVQPHILVIEDEFLVRMMLSDVLREEGFTVTEAFNADEALEILSARLPDLIITDVRMPGSCDGIELMTKVRESNLSLPIIVTSAHLLHVSDRFNGPTHFLSKPYDYNAIIKIIKSEFEKLEARRQKL